MARRLFRPRSKGCAREAIKNLFLEVRESNLGAIAFYERFGFSKIGRRKIYYRDPEEAAITMGKKLGEARTKFLRVAT